MTKKKKHGYDELLRCKPRGLRTTSQANYFRSTPKHHSQKKLEPIDGWPAFTYHIAPTYDFKQEMLSHGAFVEVLSPDWFRDDISEDIVEMANKLWTHSMKHYHRVKWITYSDDIPRIAVGNSPLHHLLFFNTETVEKNPKTYLMESTAVPRVGDRIIEDDWVVNAVILKGDEVVELEVVSIEDYEENL